MSAFSKGVHTFRKNRELFLISLPAVLMILVFTYLPILGL